MEFLTNLASFSVSNTEEYNFFDVASFLDPFGKVAGSVAKLLGLVK